MNNETSIPTWQEKVWNGEIQITTLYLYGYNLFNKTLHQHSASVKTQTRNGTQVLGSDDKNFMGCNTRVDLDDFLPEKGRTKVEMSKDFAFFYSVHPLTLEQVKTIHRGRYMSERSRAGKEYNRIMEDIQAREDMFNKHINSQTDFS